MFWQTLSSLLQQGQKVFITFVAANTKHSPGTTGAKLLISEKGKTLGTIGGGIMEHNLINRAKHILQSKQFVPEIQTLHHKKNSPGNRSGMICSGSQTNMYFLCHPEKDAEIIAKVHSLVEQDCSGTLLIEKAGMHIKKEGPYLDQPRISLKQKSQSSWLYQEQLLNFKRIAIFGGGHCSLALSRVMQHLGYEVFILDSRKNVTTFEKNIYARSRIKPSTYKKAGTLLLYPELTIVIIMTTDYISDINSLLGVISRPFQFIGIMGSEAKIQKIFIELKQAGVSNKELSRLYAPVGLPISSQTPEEIAISVAAQILQKRQR